MKIRKRYLWNHPEKLFILPVVRSLAPYTLLSFDALGQMFDLLADANRKKIPGSIVEMGCWNGGCGAFMAWKTKKDKTDRRIWLFDSFEGLPELSEEDQEWAKKNPRLRMKQVGEKNLKATGYYSATEDRAREALRRVGANEQNVEIVKGWFQDTVPTAKKNIGPIAVLRLDGDIYESTKYCLEELYDNVSVGGAIVIDDYHLEGCRKALYEFFHARALAPYVFNQEGRAYFVKA